MSDFCIDFGSPPVLRDGCNCSGGKVNLGCTDGIGLLLVGSVDIFNLSRSGDKIVSTKSNNIDRNIKTLSNNFLSERVISFWNKLPSFVRNSVSVIDFKINLEEFKKTNNLVDTGNFWEVSNIVLAKIEGVNYIEKKKQQVQYLYKNPCVAKRKGINIS